MRYALVYGGLSGAIVIGIVALGFALDLPGHFQSAWFGYLVMLAALSLIFVGVKRYRDVECGGAIRFGRALRVGLGIAAVAAILYAAGWEAYLGLSGRDFMAEYGAGILEGMRAGGAGEAEITAKAAELREFALMYRNPAFRIAVTLIEILPVGLLIALVSAALLRHPRRLPAKR